MNTLSAKSISKSYASAAGNELAILEEINLDLTQEDSASIVGPSGCGKSTLLSILGTLDSPSGGTVLMDNVNPFELDDTKLAEFRSKNIGFIFQDHHLLPQCTVLENVLVPFLSDGQANQAQIEQATKLIDRVGLRERRLHRPAQLSGGEKQRVAIARALVRNPGLLLADEPTGNLDPATANDVIQLLLELQAETQSIMIVVTHSMDIASKTRQQLKLVDGRLVS